MPDPRFGPSSDFGGVITISGISINTGTQNLI
jgi:hypothetical protein